MAAPKQARKTEESDEHSELFEKYQQLKPIHSSKDEAIQAMARSLEQLANQHHMNVESLLREAHTTTKSQDHHREALKLERQIALLRK